MFSSSVHIFYLKYLQHHQHWIDQSGIPIILIHMDYNHYCFPTPARKSSFQLRGWLNDFAKFSIFKSKPEFQSFELLSTSVWLRLTDRSMIDVCIVPLCCRSLWSDKALVCPQTNTLKPPAQINKRSKPILKSLHLGSLIKVETFFR